MICDCCYERPGDGWYLIDQNAECWLCEGCAAELIQHVDVEEIDA